jgi:hypothetical protein
MCFFKPVGMTQPLTEMSHRNFPGGWEGGLKGSQRLRLTTSLATVGRSSRTCENPVSQPYGLPRPVTSVVELYVGVKRDL